MAAPEFEIREFLAGLTDGKDFGVGGGVVGGGHLVGGLGEHDAIFDDDGAEGAAVSGTDVFESELDGACHESGVHVAWLCHCGIVKGC